MKAIKTGIIFLFTVVVIIFISCETEQTGTLIISLPGSSAEREAVNNDLINKLELTYDISIKGSEEISFKSEAGKTIFLGVPAGLWEISIIIFDAVGVKIGEGTQLKSVAAGRKTYVKFSIKIELPIFLTINGISAQGDNYTVLIFKSDYAITINDLPSGTSAVAKGKVRAEYSKDDIRQFELFDANNNKWTATGKYTVILDSGEDVTANSRYRRAINVDFINGIAKIVDTDGKLPGDLIYFP